ncbi:MAG: DGQHR domain-containing protein [Patescibacteria group bacterium]|nr:DGQHR domain-containing protein [Patescibacteria group bacterium]
MEYRKYVAEGWRPKNRRAKKNLILQKKRKPWQLFEDQVFLFFKDALKFPFVEKGKHYGRSQVDIAAGIDDILLIIDCKTKEEPGPKNLHTYITAHAGKQGTIKNYIHQQFGKKYKHIQFILVVKDIDYSERDVQYAKESNVYLWGERYFEIIEYLYQIIGPESRYYFLKELAVGDMPIKDGSGRYFECPSLMVQHNSIRIYNFFIEATKLLKLAYVANLDRGTKYFYQRLVNKSRLQEIGQFIEQNGTFKNCIIVSFENRPPRPKIIKSYKSEDDNQINIVHLKIKKIYLSLWIIDGQHRLYGFARVSDMLKKNLLPVVAIEDADKSEQARTFVDINQKQKPVDSSLLWVLFDQLRSDREEGAISRLVKRLANSGIFYGKIYIPGTSRRRRKNYTIFFSNFCKGILDRNIIDAKDNNSLYRLLGKNGYNGGDIDKVANELEKYFRLLCAVSKSTRHPKWINGFILTNNGLNVFLRVFARCLIHCRGVIHLKEWNTLLRAPLKQFFYENYEKIDELRRKTSSEGTREDLAYTIIGLINRSDPSGLFAQEYILRKNHNVTETDTYKVYESLEKNLRKLLKVHLGKISTNWWKERLPEDVRERAEEAHRKGNNPNPFIITQPRNVIECLDFMDYPKIFTRGDNWRDIFKEIFCDEEVLRTWFKELKPIRNKIAHPANMSTDEKSKFLENCEKLNKIIEQKI